MCSALNRQYLSLGVLLFAYVYIMADYSKGTKPLVNLSAYPFSRHASQDIIKAKVIERGTQVESLAGCKYRLYNGIAWRLANYGQTEKFTTKGRVVIDPRGWNRFNPNQSVYVTPLYVSPSSNNTGEFI